MNGIRFALVLAAITGCIHSASAADPSITLATTPAVDATGLLTNILPSFTARTGIAVKIVAQPTGRALDTARRGDADLVLVADPAAEREFIDEGYGTAHRQVAWNDFVVVGPSERSRENRRRQGRARGVESDRGRARGLCDARRPQRREHRRVAAVAIGRPHLGSADAGKMVPQHQWRYERGARRRCATVLPIRCPTAQRGSLSPTRRRL